MRNSGKYFPNSSDCETQTRTEYVSALLVDLSGRGNSWTVVMVSEDNISPQSLMSKITTHNAKDAMVLREAKERSTDWKSIKDTGKELGTNLKSPQDKLSSMENSK